MLTTTAPAPAAASLRGRISRWAEARREAERDRREAALAGLPDYILHDIGRERSVVRSFPPRIDPLGRR